MSEPQGYDDEVLPEQTSDDTDQGWGDDSAGSDDRDVADDDRLTREKPPHW